MRTFTIAVVALAAMSGPLAAQANRSERAVRERAAVRQQIEELEARHRRMIAELPRHETDRDYIRELREIEVTLQRAQQELHGVAVHERAQIEEMEHALIEAQDAIARQNLHARARIEEAEHAQGAAREVRAHEQLLEREQLEHALRAAQDARAHEQLLEREQLEEMEQALRSRERDADGRLRRDVMRRLFEDFDADDELDRLYGDGPRASRARQDPADSLWRAARDQMNRRDYEDAAGLFARIHTQERYRRSAYRADALYWHAFALNRIGTRDGVRESLELLQRLIREYPEDDRHADTNGLMTTVQVRLAEMGNLNARQQVRATAVDEVMVATNVETKVRADQARAAGVAVAVPIERLRIEPELQVDQLRQLDAIVAGIPNRDRQVQLVDGVVIGSADDARIVTWGLPPGRLTSLSPQCAREESEIQLIALNSLVRMDTAAAMPVLREVMARRDGCSAPLRQSAMTIIARIRNPEAERILTETARSDPDTGVRRTALVYLSSRNEEQAVGIAAEALRTASDADEQQWALQALARMRTDRAWSVVRDYAVRSDLPSETRRSAIAILSGSNDTTNTAFLRGLYSRVGNDRELKEAILMSSAFRRGAADPEWLFAIAADDAEDDRIREYAVMALSRNSEVGTPRFVELYDRSEDKRIKLSLLRVLARRAESETVAVDKLISIARTEGDTDLRKTAVLGLPANDPRARELLLEILRGMQER
jgi:hypothetical protein